MMTAHPPQIREATADDAMAVARVHVASWRAAYRGLVSRTLMERITDEERAGQWRPVLSGEAAYPRSRNLVALVDGTVCGFVCFGPARRDLAPPPSASGEVYALYSVPGVWGRGVGRAMMDAALDGLREDAHVEALLWVLRGNARARRFYERTGWVTDGGERARESERLPVPAVRYRRAI